MDHVEAVTFDSYSTLVDVDAVRSALSERVADPEPISNHWRSRSLLYTTVANEIDAYDSFYSLNRAALEHALKSHGVELSDSEREAILETYHDLAVFDDVREGIEALTAAGIDAYVLSNGNPEMLDSMIESAAIGDLIEDTISAEEVETFKPRADLYRHAADRVGTPIEDIAHVSALFYDVLGASHAGMTGIWLDRGKGPWDGFAGDPDVTIESILELPETI